MKKILLLLLFIFIFASGEVYAKTKNPEDLAIWIKKFKFYAASQGIEIATLNRAFANVEYKERIISLDRKQPEKTISFFQYKKNILSKKRIYDGRKFLRKYSSVLTDISDKYGVPKHIIVALLGIETNYGTYMGSFNVIEALTTLAYDSRRSKFFTAELIAALKILQEGHIDLDEMQGSWAGAMGQCQFMPSSFLRLAVDFNQDGKIDIWNTKADIFASAANYLKQSGWREGEKWGRKVKVTKAIDKNLLGLKLQKDLNYWDAVGVRKLNGQRLPTDIDMKASLIEFTNGKDIETYLVYNNYRVIMKWNKSTYFATAVGLLSDKINQ